MTREEAKNFLIDISYKLGNMAIEYLSERDGEKMREAIKALEQESCDDAISREAVREFVQSIQEIKSNHNENGTPINYGTICDLVISGWRLMQLPPVNPQESKTGHWREDETNIYTCSNCSHCFSIVPEDNSIKQYKYCPNCRARMFDPIKQGQSESEE